MLGCEKQQPIVVSECNERTFKPWPEVVEEVHKAFPDENNVVRVYFEIYAKQ